MRRLLSLATAALLLGSCEMYVNHSVRGDGNRTTQERTVGSFSSVEVSGPFDVTIVQGTASSVQVEADGNLQEYVEVTVKGDELEIRTRHGINIRTKRDIHITVTSPTYRVIAVAGSGNVKGATRLKSDGLELSITGSGDMNLDVDAPMVKTSVTGSGSMTLNGASRILKAEISGSGEVHAFGLMAEQTDVDIAGSGDAEVFASKTLRVDIAGAGDVAYKGGAAVSQSVAGSGNIRKAD
ncbi:MAG: hypothetical protein JWP27_836 [Flaviaesturariibacter sp.]|nr:hypothetical protein [Flaviaesturariibacter sp.]